jgi:hypothetical protein
MTTKLVELKLNIDNKVLIDGVVPGRIAAFQWFGKGDLKWVIVDLKNPERASMRYVLVHPDNLMVVP